MRFVVYLDREGTTWPPPKTAPGEPIVLEIDASVRLDDAAAEAIDASGPATRAHYHVGVEHGLFYWAVSLRDASASPPELVPFPRAVPDHTGELIWTEGARHQVTLADLQRARTEGFFEGDPAGVFLERPMYGEAPPGWLDLIEWLASLGSAVSGVAMLVALLRKRVERWKARGAVTPFAFLDLVPAREKWNEDHLAQLLGIDGDEATDLLTSFGYVRGDENERLWVVSHDPEASALRKRIIEGWLHRTNGDDQEES